MIISLQIWVPKYAVTDCFFIWLAYSTCVRLGEGGWMYWSTNKALCFLLHLRPGLSVKSVRHFVMLPSPCLGLPTQRQVLLLLIRITCICSESCFCWNLKSQRLAARVWTDLLEICWIKLVNAEKGHPSARCNRLPEYDAVYGMIFLTPRPSIILTVELIFWASLSGKAF